ncbi:tRNA (N6-threonylcarbamoyladenosine(37)-N6)-methyltransferase TrmO [uncultured Akkermansia sp.]|uniref:tRNA (N6-threonylcarbamoyladenosine(37)-N6)-methyltransferase TrmO n=1 Tax=uncultured Akkermansia sp. TaxID=512294 RepID=UPI0025DE5E99|nr:tRNA (N6-threonylcarbamoyladenosine(37)-N6)-methyltransferase TrmO [uncultured Akkermansia sp.]
MHPVARVSTCYPDKFGVPRQSGLVPGARARLVFEPPFRNPDAVRGLEGFSHVWLIWVFSENLREGWSPTVRPPRLGGNVRMGVFATRAPFRPNPIGLSAVRLERVELHPQDGPVLHLSGVDLVDGTPILDIKPYVPLADCIPEAAEGFTASPYERLDVEIPAALGESMPPEELAALAGTLSLGPRPQYQDDPERVYGLLFSGREVKFRVAEGRLHVLSLEPSGQRPNTGD